MQKKPNIDTGTDRIDERYEWISDERVAAYNAYIERKSKIPDLVGISQVIAILVGIAIAVMMMSLPFILHMAVVNRDHSLTRLVTAQVAFMGDEERGVRLMEAQQHNASVSGWGSWPASVDNEGMAGASRSLTDDIQVPSASPTEEMSFDDSSPLDVGDGLIGWVTIPTGRTVPMMDDRISERYSRIGRFSWERWSCLPVGGHGTLCVLTLSDGDSSSVIEDDLNGIQIGDTIAIGALGDMYAYRIARIEAGPQTDVMEKLIKRAGDDSIAILVGKDGDGTMTAIMANRTRYEGVRSKLFSPAVEACRKQMVMGMSIGLLSATLFLFAWKFKRDDRRERDALEQEELQAFQDASRKMDKGNDNGGKHAETVRTEGEDGKETGKEQGDPRRQGPPSDDLGDLDLGLVAKYAMRGVSHDIVQDVMQRVGDSDAQQEGVTTDGSSPESPIDEPEPADEPAVTDNGEPVGAEAEGILETPSDDALVSQTEEADNVETDPGGRRGAGRASINRRRSRRGRRRRRS